MTSGRKENETELYGMNYECLFLGADNVPMVHYRKRGEIWDISPACRYLWDTASLKEVGEWIGIEKLDADFNDAGYGFMDAVITLKAAHLLTLDLEEMGFEGTPDTFVSGATVSKDFLKKYYTPFYLDQEQHNFCWPAYFGGMTGATKPQYVRGFFENVKYGDLDGAYNASGQMLQVFNWNGVKWLTEKKVRKILEEIEKDPMTFWKYGSLHIEVKGNFNAHRGRFGL